MKKNLIILALGLVAMMPAKAQWSSWNTSSTISGVFGAINHGIESAERKKAMEIHAKEKVEYEQSFKDAMESAKDYEGGEYWGDALSKYEEAAKLNCNYGYTDQQQITRKINELYVKASPARATPPSSWPMARQTALRDSIPAILASMCPRAKRSSLRAKPLAAAYSTPVATPAKTALVPV